MRILVVSSDIGPARSLVRLDKELVDQGHKVAGSYFLDPIPELLEQYNPDVMISGMSSHDASHELAIAESAITKKIPVVWFADTYGVFNRPYPDTLKSKISLLFVPDNSEKVKAEAAGYKNVVAVGVPLWEEFVNLDNFPTREEVRVKLSIAEKERLVLLCGTDTHNKRFIAAVISAIKSLNDPNMITAFRAHPSDPDKNSYEVLFRNLRHVDTSSIAAKTDDLVPAADLVVSPLSTVGLTAIYQRKRVIDCALPYLLDVLEEKIGIRTWSPIEVGASYGIFQENEIAIAINTLFSEKGYAELQRKQQLAYSVGKNGSVKKMVEHIKRIAQPQ